MVVDRDFHIQNRRRLNTEPAGSSNDVCELIRRRRRHWQYVQLSESPRVEYLNLLDYQEKVGDFHSTPYGPLDRISTTYNFRETQERLWGFSCTNIFVAFVQHLKDISADAENLSGLCRKIANVTKYVKKCDMDFLQLLLTRVVHMCLDLKPQHGVLLITVMKHLCVLNQLKIYVIERLLLTGTKHTFLRYILHYAVEDRFDFWNTWKRNSSYSDLPCCPVTLAYLAGKFGHLKVLLEYGFQQNYLITLSSLSTVALSFENLSYTQDIALCRWLSWFMPHREFESRSTIVDEVIFFICMLQDESPLQERLVRSFQLLWSARKDPFVTQVELQDVFEKMFLEYPDTNLSRECLMVCLDKYLNSVLENDKWRVPQPRSLQHLCRCTIREVLSDQWRMPYGVVSLPLPDSMKSYILLKTNKRPQTDYVGDSTVWNVRPII